MLYGAPIWLPSTSIIKNIASASCCSPAQLIGLIKKINRQPYEKSHMSFLKWALGVHKKSSNIGCWGETGRYPLLYQSIKMSLKYFQRIDKLKPTSFVHLALVEHKRMNLPWYSNIECLLKIDEIYYKDHVTAFKHMHIKEFNQNITKNDLTKNLNGNKILNPLPSKKFRVEEILKHLKSHFIKCWNY